MTTKTVYISDDDTEWAGEDEARQRDRVCAIARALYRDSESPLNIKDYIEIIEWLNTRYAFIKPEQNTPL